MSYRKHPTWEGWYVVTYWDGPQRKGGKLRRDNIRGSEEDAAEHDRRMRQMHVSTTRSKANPFFRDIWEEWAGHLKANKKSDAYLKSIEWAWKRLKPVFGNFPVARITEQMVNQYKASRGATPRACNQELEYLKICINWGKKRGYCNTLPFEIEKVQYAKKIPRPPSPSEYDKLIQQMTENKKQSRRSDEEFEMKQAMLEIMHDQGLRFIEVSHITWENVNLTAETVYLGRTKGGKDRFCLLPPAAKVTMEKYKGKKRRGYVFTNPRTGEPYKSLRKGLQGNAAKAGFTISGPHALRHAAGTDMYDATDDIKGSQVLLGHTQLKTTDIYTHVSTKKRRDITEKMRKYREESKKG